MDSPFDALDVAPDATPEEVERAYRRQVKEAHPDHGGSVREFQRIRAAYERIQSEEVDLDAADADGERAREESGTRVEYLDYEVLDDHGWTIGDEDLFEKAADAGLDPGDHGRFLVESDETLLQAAENRGFSWPYACRGGACANCAVAMCEGDLSMPVDHILTDGMEERGIRLSCVGTPAADELRVVYNVKHLPGLDELRLPPRPFRGANASD